MERTRFAQHADAGDLHLETRFVPGLGWEWEVFRRGRESVEHGTARSLEDAKAQAAKRANVEEGTIIWKDIGPTIGQ